MPKRVKDEERRVALNCLVKPGTLAWLKGAGDSQGQAVDRAVECLRAMGSPVPQQVEEEIQKRKLAKMLEPLREKPLAVERKFKAPIPKPKDRKK